MNSVLNEYVVCHMIIISSAESLLVKGPVILKWRECVQLYDIAGLRDAREKNNVFVNVLKIIDKHI